MVPPYQLQLTRLALKSNSLNQTSSRLCLSTVPLHQVVTPAPIDGSGTYTFIGDATTIEITMPAGTQGFQALNSFVTMVLAQKGAGRAAFATTDPAALSGGLNSTAVAPNGISPILTTGITSNRYQMHLADKQLTMTDKNGVTLIYKKWAYSL